MDIPAAAAAPWLVLGLALGIALAVLAGLVVLLSRRRATAAGRHEQSPTVAALSPGGYTEDDLPGFLESPPGSGSGAPRPRGGWPALSAAPLPRSGAPSPPSSSGATSTAGVLGAMSLAALVLIAAAAAVAVAQEAGTTRPAAEEDARAAAPQADRPSPAPAPPSGAGDLADASVPPGDDGAAAELAFEGVVLERRAVGVTATYPVVEVSWNGDRAVAHVELPTFNCLRDQAPEDPVAAGCSRSVTEYADLAADDLEVRRDGDALVVTGAFPTYLRPNGTAPVWTGRRYELLITAEPERRGPGWRPASGVLELGEDSAPTTGAEVNRIRFGG